MRKAGGLQRWELWAVVAILLMAAALRLVALRDVPPGLRYDELLNYRMAQRVLAGEFPIYFHESWGHEPLFHYTQAASIALTKACDWSLRLPAALFGLSGVLTTWLVARRLFGPRVAALAAAGLAVSFWSVFYSRDGLRGIAIVPFSCLMVYFIWRGLERSSPLDFVLGGVCLGGMFYTYMAARVFPLLPAAFALYLFLFHRPDFKRAWWGLLMAIVLGGLLAAPLLAVVYGQPGTEQRVAQLAGAWTALQAGDPLPVLDLAVHALGMFVWRGQEDWLYNVYGRPVFEPLAAVCFVAGVALCIWRWRRARCLLLFLWLGVSTVPAMIAEPPSSISHAVAAQSPAYIMLGLGLDALWRAVQKRWRRIGPLLVAVVVGSHGALSGYAYFVTWASAPEVRELHQGGVAAVARELDAHEPPGPVVIGAPYVNYWHPWNAVGFDLALRRDDLSVRWFDPAGGWVWPAGAGPVTAYFPIDPLGPQAFDSELQAVFFADAELITADRDDFMAFRVESPAAFEDRLNALASLPMAWPADKAHLPSPALPLFFDGRFALLGAELQVDSVRPGDQLRLLTYWEVVAADPTPVVAFVHLTSGGTDIWGQVDWLSVWADGLQPGDRFVQVHPVPVKPETPPGTYHAMLGLYTPPDWQQRLLIATGSEGTSDRVLLGEIVVE
ncbi:MAG: glycosyltransferase family 39 protein [Anaerolineae bacterium]|nr:glycosyltransferase family 39 protein [Anaerolineae bacterium]